MYIIIESQQAEITTFIRKPIAAPSVVETGQQAL
jgi:hypothetical protein